VIGEVARTLLTKGARTQLGFRALSSLAHADPQVVVQALGPRVNRGARFSTVRDWPEALIGFDDLAFLFSSHQLHHAIISMAVDEAAYVYHLASGLHSATLVEIGRSKGGSTLLLATAADKRSHVWSYDLHVKSTAGDQSDRELLDTLERYGLADRVTLVVDDSKTAAPPPTACDLVLVDGDHSYEGVRADFETWAPRVRRGGHVLFHDAAELGDLSSGHATVMRFIEELDGGRNDGFVRRGGAGTLLHYERVR
jgi:predicted O-methyltransferase YrrM